MQRPARNRPANRTGRDADPRRTLKLNGSAWQRLRASVLAGEPLCRHCAARGLTVPATDVDHMNGADDTGARKLDKSRATGRIDGMQALAMAMGVAARTEEAASIYEDGAFTFV